MTRLVFLTLCGFTLTACSWFGDTPNEHLSQKAQWEALGYKDGLKSVKR